MNRLDCIANHAGRTRAIQRLPLYNVGDLGRALDNANLTLGGDYRYRRDRLLRPKVIAVRSSEELPVYPSILLNLDP